MTNCVFSKSETLPLNGVWVKPHSLDGVWEKPSPLAWGGDPNLRKRTISIFTTFFANLAGVVRLQHHSTLFAQRT